MLTLYGLLVFIWSSTEPVGPLHSILRRARLCSTRRGLGDPAPSSSPLQTVHSTRAPLDDGRARSQPVGWRVWAPRNPTPSMNDGSLTARIANGPALPKSKISEPVAKLPPRISAPGAPSVAAPARHWIVAAKAVGPASAAGQAVCGCSQSATHSHTFPTMSLTRWSETPARCAGVRPPGRDRWRRVAFGGTRDRHLPLSVRGQLFARVGEGLLGLEPRDVRRGRDPGC